MENITITQKALEQFYNYLRQEEKAKATIEKYMRDVRSFTQYCSESILTKDTVLSYKADLSERYAARSVNSILASLNSFFTFLGLPQLRVKTLKIQRQAFCPEETELSRCEFQRLCDAAKQKKNERLLLIMQTICGTGIRISELQFITVDAVNTGEAIVACKGKHRAVFIVDNLRNKLKRYIHEHKISRGPVFVTASGKAMDRSNIWRSMKALCKEADVSDQKVFPHNLRHLFARVFYELDKDLAKLADVLGHSSIDTTRIYIVSSGEEHRKMMEKMRLIL